MTGPTVPIVAACDDANLFGFDLWPKQRELLAAVEAGPRIHVQAIGRRGTKSTMAALAMLHSSLFRPDLDAMVRPGETRYAVAIATKEDQAALLIDAAGSILDRSPMLSELVASRTSTEIRFELPSGARTAIKAMSCSSRSIRGYPISLAVLDEAAHFLADTAGPATAEKVWTALYPATAQFGDLARLLVISTPFGDSGFFADLWKKADSGKFPEMRAYRAPTTDINPTITAAHLEIEKARDPETFAGEYLAEFLASGSAFIDWELVAEPSGEPALPSEGKNWLAGLDPAFSRDAFGVAIVGESIENKGQLVLGPVFAIKPDSDSGFGTTVVEVAKRISDYTDEAVTDQFCSKAVQEKLAENGVTARIHNMDATSKTKIFQQLRAVLYDDALRLYDHPELVGELRRLQTRYAPGKSSVVNPRRGGSHGDMVQALAMGVFERTKRRASEIDPEFLASIGEINRGFRSASHWGVTR